MPAPLSSHIPGVAGADVNFTTSTVIDTGLETMLTFVAMQKSDPAANEESTLSWAEVSPRVAGDNVKVTLFSWKGGTNHADAGDSAVDASWVAVGT